MDVCNTKFICKCKFTAENICCKICIKTTNIFHAVFFFSKVQDFAFVFKTYRSILHLPKRKEKLFFVVSSM